MIGQPDNLVDPPEGRRDTMEGPADSSDPAPVVTDAVASPPPVADVAPVPPRPCRITFHGFAPSEPPRIEVRAWLARLGALTAPMTGGEVAIEALEQGRKERRYRVRMELVMPAGAVLVGSDHPANLPHEDVYVAIRNAFRAARRELELRPQALAPALPAVSE
jgi:hypothetical protein